MILLTIKIFILYFILFISLTRQQPNPCTHDTYDTLEMTPSNFFYTFNAKYGNRKFYGNSAKPIRITFEMSDIPNYLTSQVTKNDIINLFDALNKYMRQDPIINVSGKNSCKSYTYSNTFKNSGQSNSDFHVFLKFTNATILSDPEIVGWICELDPNPVAGVIMFNLPKMGSILQSTDHFQKNFISLLHQFIHLLGFSMQIFPMWINNLTKQPYGTSVAQILSNVQFGSNKYTRQLKSFNIKHYSINHYDCSLNEGILLENTPSFTQQISHWEIELTGYELMVENSFLYNVVAVTGMTVALLSDTGFYDSINNNMGSNLEWGFFQKCLFMKTCTQSQPLFEFPETQSTLEGLCDYFQLGFIERTNKLPNSECAISSPISQNFCVDDQKHPPNENDRMNTGPTSRCFKSNAYKKGSSETTKYKCFKAECKYSNSQIDISLWAGVVISCMSPKIKIELINFPTLNTEGYIYCPQDFNFFCNAGIFCKNSCNNKGFCNKGVCFCIAGWSGEDCSKQCSLLENNVCVQYCSLGKYENPNGVCLTTCPTSFYPDTITQKCNICHSFCSKCTGPNPDQCYDCNHTYPYDINDKKCYDKKCDASCVTCYGKEKNNCLSCRKGYYLDTNNQCQPCDIECETCEEDPKKCILCKNQDKYYDSQTNSCIISQNNCHSSCRTCTVNQDENMCKTCANGYIKNEKTNICETEIRCDITCKKCLVQNRSDECTECYSGYFLTNLNQCKQCATYCKECFLQPNDCLSCKDNYEYDSINKKCKPPCESPCSQCQNVNSVDQCVKCEIGYFLTSQKCEKCQSPCLECSNKQDECLSCINNQYIYQPQSKRCDIYCDVSCKKCSQANKVDACTECKIGFFLTTQNRCEKCQSPCLECIDKSDKCLSCINNDYKFDNNTQTCNLICDQSCKKCSAPKKVDACTECLSGYYLTLENRCEKCQSPCKDCSQQQNLCTSCITTDYKYDNITKACSLNCDISCETCQQSNKNQCMQCANGYFTKSNFPPFVCQRCKENCSICKSDFDNCSVCRSGYKLKGTTCTPICHPTCLQCDKQNDNVICNVCINGFYLINNRCQKCESPCQTCSKTANQCTSCEQNYKLVSEKCEFGCHFSCKSCYQTDDEQSCIICQPGFYHDDIRTINSISLGMCKACQQNCEKCERNGSNEDGSNDIKCLQCKSGYEFDILGNCTLCDQSCQTCFKPKDPQSCITCFSSKNLDSSNKCIECKNNQFFSTETKQCTQCQQGCTACTSIDQCQECQKDFTLNKAGLCEKNYQCHYSCKECTSSSFSSCSSCKENRILQILNIQNQTGVCDCPQSMTDNGYAQCDNGVLQKTITQASKTSFVISASVITAACKFFLPQFYKTKISDLFIISLSQFSVFENLDSSKKSLQYYKWSQNLLKRIIQFIKEKQFIFYFIQITSNNFILLFKKLAIVNSNPVSFILMMEFCQSISYLSYINYKPPLGVDGVMNSISYSHFSKFKIFSFLEESKSKETNKNKEVQNRILQADGELSKDGELSDDQEEEENVKFKLNEKSNSFLVNALLIIGINIITWILSGFFSLLKVKKSSSFLLKVKRIFCISAPIAVFSLSSQEFSLLIFLQLKQGSFDSSLQIANQILSIISLIYIASILCYLTYQMEYTRKQNLIQKRYKLDTEMSHRNEFSHIRSKNELQSHKSSKHDIYSVQASRQEISSQRTSKYEKSQLGSARDQSSKRDFQDPNKTRSDISYEKESTYESTDQIDIMPQHKIKLYFIYKYVKQDNIFTRNFVQITVLRKIIISLSSVQVNIHPFAQISVQLLGYILYSIYLLVIKPLKYPKQMLMMCIVDCIIALMHMFYIIMMVYEGDILVEKIMSMAILFMTISVFIMYFGYSVFILIKIFYFQVQQCVYRSSQLRIKFERKSHKSLSKLENQEVIIQVNQDILEQTKSPQGTFIFSSQKFISQNNQMSPFLTPQISA